MNDYADRLIDCALDAWTPDPPNPIAWGEEFVRFPLSALSQRFDCVATPWLRDPILHACRGIWLPAESELKGLGDIEARIVTLMKPVQTGGSAAGELFMLYCLQFGRGLFQYNWPDDDAAKFRWNQRILGILEANLAADIARARAGDRLRVCELDLLRAFLQVQGTFAAGSLDSATVMMQLNEEIHNWKPGNLDKARNRLGAVWNRKSFDVSNAGKKGDQLDQAVRAGTDQRWESYCPGCSNKHRSVFHEMRTRWDDKHPELGGLRYKNLDKIEGGGYDYTKAQVWYQMPCGYQIGNDVAERREVSMLSRYGAPRNKGADGTHRSFSYDSVAVDFIDWLDIIKKKHAALRARRFGDPEPWRKYLCEVECVPYDPDDVPIHGETISLSSGVKKSRAGLPAPRLRLGALDRQMGERQKGELPHWWGLVRDVKAEPAKKIRSRLVVEGKFETDEQAAAAMNDAGLNPWQVVVDSGDDTTHVYLFCLQHGFNAIKGGKEYYYAHPGGARRIFSPERPLHEMVNRPPLFNYVPMTVGGKRTMMPDPREPMFWLYSKAGIRDRLAWMRAETDFETPDDVSTDYLSHMESEELIQERHPKTGEVIGKWIQLKARNDLFVDEAYIAMQLDMAGLIGTDAANKTEGTQIK
jgi:hypothetical protein